jgi:hypothetical protein
VRADVFGGSGLEKEISMSRYAHRFLHLLPIALLASALGCASGLPAVISSSPDRVSVEFAKDGSVKDTSKMAQEACAKVGKTADFDKVDTAASPDSRIAHYNCVGGEEKAE